MNKMRIKVVSDVMCPWCVIGYKNLAKAIELSDGLGDVDITWHPFELNPQMPLEGQEVMEHITEKYGITPEQSEQNRKHIEAMGEQADFKFQFSKDSLMINSFDCHRLLTWSAEYNKQTELKLALFKAHFSENKHLNDKSVLIDIVTEVGLDAEKARDILDSDQYSEEVRAEQNSFQQMGITSVPTFIINDQYAISGGQPVDAFQKALLQISSQTESG